MTITELAAEVMARCEVLAQFSETPGELTRTFLSEPMHFVHAQLKVWLEEAGMSVRIDAAGNIMGHYGSAGADAPVFLVGSHLDTVRNAGKYDGALGVLLGVAAVKALQGRRLPFALEVIGFSEEEGVRFGVPFIGSKAVTRQLDDAMLSLQDAEGITVTDALTQFGLDASAVPAAAYKQGELLGFLEIHIEQGPRLASLDKSLGIVSAIAGSSRANLSFTGKAGHAGTTPMSLRQDALAGAAAFILEVERLAQATPDLVATVGMIKAAPGAINVISGAATLSLDVRHTKDSVRQGAVKKLEDSATKICGVRGLELGWQGLMDQEAVPMDPTLSQKLSSAAGIDIPVMPSGAGHDAMIMAPFTPTALLFVRSPNGISHHPDERVTQEDVGAALETVTEFLLGLEPF